VKRRRCLLSLNFPLGISRKSSIFSPRGGEGVPCGFQVRCCSSRTGGSAPAGCLSRLCAGPPSAPRFQIDRWKADAPALSISLHSTSGMHISNAHNFQISGPCTAKISSEQACIPDNSDTQIIFHLSDSFIDVIGHVINAPNSQISGPCIVGISSEQACTPDTPNTRIIFHHRFRLFADVMVMTSVWLGFEQCMTTIGFPFTESCKITIRCFCCSREQSY
jgi:hypothetical protein